MSRSLFSSLRFESLNLVSLGRALKLIEGLKGETLLPENISLEPIRCSLRDLVLDVGASGHGKDVVQLFERPLFCLGDKTEDHAECANI